MGNPLRKRPKPRPSSVAILDAKPSPMRIGVISDTHNFLDPAIRKLFAGVEHILHAGDIGQQRLLMELEEIAPVTAVGGNTDDPGFRFPHFEAVTLVGWRFLIHHIVDPYRLSDSLAERVKREHARVVVFGHTHKPFRGQFHDVLYFNPGYAGKTRFGMQRSVAVLVVSPTEIQSEILLLDS